MGSVSCDVCNREFDYINSLIRHRKLAHPENQIYKCSLCNFESNDYIAYKNHMRLSHRNQVQLSISGLICDICGKEFLCHYNLASHRKIHKDPQYRCSFCGNMFKTKRAATHHERLHTGEKPFTCETCGKSFPGKNYLINHQNTHTAVKPHVCDICGKAFVTRWNLIQHERIHTGERPYHCPLCDNSYVQNFLLKRHLLKVHQKDWQDYLKPQKRSQLETFPSDMIDG